MPAPKFIYRNNALLAQGRPQFDETLIRMKKEQEDLALTDPVRAQVLLRCAQEMITNSVRHARADNLWIGLEHDENGVALIARDDGRGAKVVEPGNGLTGMSERLRQLGGELKFESKPGEGFRLHAWLPAENMT